MSSAIIVAGPESSGTRLLTSAFVAAGCQGEATHGQQFDCQFPNAEQIVWRRSFPHGGQWPDAVGLINKLREANYAVKVAVMTRDWHCTAQSQLARGHVRSKGAGQGTRQGISSASGIGNLLRIHNLQLNPTGSIKVEGDFSLRIRGHWEF